MRKIILSLLVVFVCVSAGAQSQMAKIMMDSTPYQKVVFSDIELEVSSPATKYYYPVLYERYEKGDTSLNLDDYRHLYYGYMFQAEYQPHKESPYVDSLSKTISMDGDIFTDKSAMKCIGYLEKILDDRPFSLKFLNMMSYLYAEKVRDEKRAQIYSYKFNMVLSTIFSSGNGRVKNSPWLVLYRSDAQSVLQFLGADVTKRVYITTNVEYYHLRERQEYVRGYYFDFDPIYTRPLEPKGKRKMEFNPLSNPKSDKYINTKLKDLKNK